MPSFLALDRRAQARCRVLCVMLAALLMVPALTPVARMVGDWLGTQVSVIVRGQPGGGAAAQQAVGAVGGHVVRAIGIVDGVSATVPVDQVGTLQHEPGVVEVTPNLPVHMQGSGWGRGGTWSPVTDLGSLYNTTLDSGAQTFWQAGYTGKGVDVALIDTGVVPVNGLQVAGKVVYGPDLSFDSQRPNLTNLDTYGHGTFMAGMIAGRDNSAVTGQYAGDSTDFLGTAPDARVVSIKVADSHGNTDVSQVLAAIDWVVVHHADPGFNIRVVNMSFGTDSYQSYVYDPLAYAAETAWHAGIVVVGATGNSGWKTGVLDPADDPYVIAVGSSDDMGTATLGDDTVSPYSAGGDGNRNPDLVAPGAHVVSLRDPGSYIDVNNPTAVVASRFFRGSGTSMSAAVASGAAALLLSENPLLTPDQVKNLLTSTAFPLAGASRTLQGAGELNLRSALTAVPALAVQAFAPATGTGSLDGARGSARLSWNGVALQGEVDIFGLPVNTASMASSLASGSIWTGGVFNGVAWTAGGWGTMVTSDGWTGRAWNDGPWTNNSWSNNSWSNNSWSNNSWSNNSWSNNSWSNNSWSNNSWSDAVWSDAAWS
ncbi:MAG TPA: S8 family serine peptidase [Candidatus Dormibacteraeota bacterium]|nr:S8 family serine peptidase [Candidatus Dormibacteraeota bacterium]